MTNLARQNAEIQIERLANKATGSLEQRAATEGAALLSMDSLDHIVCFDMEGTLTPEIWEQVAIDSGISELSKTTRDIPSYSDLMDYRIEIMKQHNLKLDGIFVQIGLIPNSNFLNDLVEKTQFGEIIIDEKCQTSAAGIFACGDVTTVPYKQIIIAMGEGSKASLSAFEYLLTEGDRLEEMFYKARHEDIAMAS